MTSDPTPYLIVKVVVALVHLLQSEAPLVLHMDVRVELPLSGLDQLTRHTHTQITKQSFKLLKFRTYGSYLWLKA